MIYSGGFRKKIASANKDPFFEKLDQGKGLYGADSLTSPPVLLAAGSNIDYNNNIKDNFKPYIFGKNIIGLGQQAFYDTKKNISSICLANVYYFSGHSQFNLCQNLEEVQLPKITTANIPQNAFYNCIKLKKIQVSKNYSGNIEQSAFSGCIRLTDIGFLTKAHKIGPYAFQGCRSLFGDFNFPYAKAIDFSAFYGCSNIRKLNFPSATFLGISEVFRECSSLKEIRLPAVTEFSRYGTYFNKCTSLREIYCKHSQVAIVREAIRRDSTIDSSQIKVIGV